MKQLLILSGKGGTGKTTVTGAFIKLANAKAYADCDVDAPNLHLIMKQDVLAQKTDYYGLPKAKINKDLCIGCGLCLKNCRFEAVKQGEAYTVDVLACEGCGVCEAVCPNGAIVMEKAVAGELMLYTGEAVFSTAQLKMGSGTSGKLVTEVKKQMRQYASGASLAVIDGSPGIGCPVIASMSGADMVLIVAEPTVSGISDMERILETASVFGVKTAVCINKYDINLANSENIAHFCSEQNIPFIGTIPYDKEVIKAVNDGLSVVDIDCKAGFAVKEVFKNTMKILF